MTRSARRHTHHLTKAEFRPAGRKAGARYGRGRAWRRDWRSSWAGYTEGGQGHGARIPPSAKLLRLRRREGPRWPARRGRKL